MFKKKTTLRFFARRLLLIRRSFQLNPVVGRREFSGSATFCVSLGGLLAVEQASLYVIEVHGWVSHSKDSCCSFV